MPLPCVKSQKQPPGQLNLGAIQLTPHELACAFVPRACTETTPAVRVAVMKAAVRNFFICAPFTITIYFLCAKSSDRIILVCEQSSSRLLVVLIELRCPKMAHPPAKNSAREFAPVTRYFPVRFVVQRFFDHRQFCAIPEGPGPSAFTERDGAILAYNLLTLRKPAGIVLSLLFLGLSVLEAPLRAQRQSGPARVSRLLLIIPFENTSNAAGTDWISESFPEVLSTRLSSSGFFIMGRDDRLNAFDRLGIPPGAKPSRATLYQVGQQLDADYL